MEQDEYLIEEYKCTQQFIIHCEKLTWNMGSILNASVIVLAGLVINALGPGYLWFAILVSAAFSFVWYRFEYRQHEISLQKFKRLHELERKLGFKQSLNVLEYDRLQNIYWTSHKLASFACISVPAILTLAWILIPASPSK
jgi:hypothetical protein